MLEWWNWYTRTTQNRMAQALRVQVPPPAQKVTKHCQLQNLKNITKVC